MNRSNISRSITRSIMKRRKSIAEHSLYKNKGSTLLNYLENRYQQGKLKKELTQYSSIENNYIHSLSVDSAVAGITNLNSPKINDIKVSPIIAKNREVTSIELKELMDEMKLDELTTPRPIDLVPIPQLKPLKFVPQIGRAHV